MSIFKRVTSKSVSRTTKALPMDGKDAGKSVVIELPDFAVEYLGIKKGKLKDTPLFITPINGVIQISAYEPSVTIPAISENVEDFVAQA